MHDNRFLKYDFCRSLKLKLSSLIEGHMKKTLGCVMLKTNNQLKYNFLWLNCYTERYNGFKNKIKYDFILHNFDKHPLSSAGTQCFNDA